MCQKRPPRNIKNRGFCVHFPRSENGSGTWGHVPEPRSGRACFCPTNGAPQGWVDMQSDHACACFVRVGRCRLGSILGSILESFWEPSSLLYSSVGALVAPVGETGPPENELSQFHAEIMREAVGVPTAHKKCPGNGGWAALKQSNNPDSGTVLQ